MILSHRIALDPTIKQRQKLRQAVGVARFSWNWALAEWKKEHEVGDKPSAYKLKRRFNQIKRSRFPWVYDSPKDANQQPFANLQAAFGRFFKKLSGYPKFKRRGVHDSFYVSNDKLTLGGKRIRLPKIGWIRLCEHLRFAGKIMSASVSRVAERWFISINVRLEDYSKPRTGDGTVGIDLGVRHAAVLSNGNVYDSPKPLSKVLARLRRANKSLIRKQKGSNRRQKARNRLARLHARVANARNDFLHKLTSQICRENQTVVIEDLDVKNMLQNRRLSRAISDIGFHEFRRQLTYKAEIYGVQLIVADRWFPSSKTCSSCGYIKNELPLRKREFVCECCGMVEDRDLNAAKNLKQLADGLSVIARGDGSSTGGLTPSAPPVYEARTKTSAGMQIG